MTKEEFIKKAKEYGYEEDGIKELLSLYDEMREIDSQFDYKYIVLVEQAVY